MPAPSHAAKEYFELRKSPIQGRGAFAIRRIRRGTRIIEYTGEHITSEEADARYDDANMKRHHTFLFILDEHTVVDAARGGNAARFINHSCEPNCFSRVMRGHMLFFALRDIAPGEEITLDYTPSQHPGRRCTCGAAKCRGVMQ